MKKKDSILLMIIIGIIKKIIYLVFPIKQYQRRKRLQKAISSSMSNNKKLPMFRINKPYSQMTKNQKAEYRRWLHKHDMWDGEIVIENMERQSMFNIKK